MAILVLVFESGLQARDALELARQLERRRMLRLDDALFLTRDADGRVSLHRDTDAGDAALGARGLPVSHLRHGLAPGDTGLVLVIDALAPNAAVTLLRIAGARILHSELALPAHAVA